MYEDKNEFESKKVEHAKRKEIMKKGDNNDECERICHSKAE